MSDEIDYYQKWKKLFDARRLLYREVKLSNPKKLLELSQQEKAEGFDKLVDLYSQRIKPALISDLELSALTIFPTRKVDVSKDLEAFFDFHLTQLDDLILEIEEV